MNYNFYINKSNLIYKNKIIKFNNVNKYLKIILTNELVNLFKNYSNIKHIFILGLGNDNYTADSIGPKSLKYLKVNYFNNNKIKISSLEPGVLTETGITTLKIIKSVADEINPDLVILIDSFISNDINNLNKSIILNTKGIVSGLGITNLNDEISYKTLKRNVIVIGVPTAVELKLQSNVSLLPYLLTTKDIDKFVLNISKVIGESINKAISMLS